MKIRLRKNILLLVSCAAVLLAGFFAFKVDFSAHAQTSDFGLEQVGEVTGLGTQDIRLTIARIIRAILGFLGVVALVIMLYGGFIYMTSDGEEEKIRTAKKIIINGTIGLAIILASFSITQFVLSRLSEATGMATTDVPANCADLSYAAAYPEECSGGTFDPCENLDNQFVVKSITPSTPAGSTGMNNFAVRVIFSQGLAAAITADEAFDIERGNADVSNEFSFNFIDANHSIIEASAPAVSVDVFPSGDYDVSVRSTLTSSGGLDLETDNVCGTFPISASFNVDTSDVLDTQVPEVSDISYNGLTYGGTIALPRGRVYQIGTAITDDSGAGYVHLEIQRRSGLDDSPIGNPIVVYDGPRVERGSEATESDPYNFYYSLLVAGNNSLYNDLLQPSYYQVILTATDIDHNSTEVISQFIVVESGCEFGTGIGDAPGCRGNGDCVSDAQCASGVCDEDTGQCLAVPIITDISPYDGAGGSWVTVIGEFFGGDPGGIAFGIDNSGDGEPDVWVPANLAQCAAEDVWRDSWVVAEVPMNDAALPNGSLSAIRITHANGDPEFFDTTINNRGSLLDLFRKDNGLTRPGLCSITPAIGLAGDPVTVYGQDLGAGGSGSQLIFGGVQAPISTWFSTGLQIDASAPENMSPGRVGVIATVNGQNSNGIPFRIVTEDQLQAPVINSITPRDTTIGSYVTIAGSRFGSTPGYVYLAPNTNTECNPSNTDCLMLNVVLPAACGDTWNSAQIIAQIPSSAGVGERVVVVENENGLQSSPAAADILNIVSGGAMPGICAISPTEGSAPLPPDNPGLDITGINFSASPIVYFWGMNSVLGNNSTWLSANGSPVTVDGLQIISTQFPVDPISGFSMQTGPIKVRASSGQESNSVTYSVDNCAQIPESRWPTGMRCCSEGSAAGVFISDDNVCPGEERTGGYVWRFTTGKIPKLPRVIEFCNDAAMPPVMPSPTPWQNYEDGENACLNRVVSVDFNMDMNVASFAGNIRMYACGSGEEPDCEEGTDISSEITAGYSPGVPGGTLIVRDPITRGNLLPNTWYHIELLEGILADEWMDVLGVPQLTNPPLLPTRPCGNGTAYCFNFKTGPAGSECVLTGAGIKPPQFTINYLGPVLNSNTNLPLNYRIWGKGDQSCSVLPVEGLGWNWITDLPTSALVTSPILGSDILATAEALQEPPANLVKITASTVYNSNLLSADSDLFIELGMPRVVEFWPNCAEACINASIGARFSRQMDDRNNFEDYRNGIHLYQCSSENVCISAIDGFKNNGALNLSGLASVPFIVLEKPLSDRSNARIAPNSILSPNTSYLVYFDNTILSVAQVDVGGNIIRTGPALEPKVWQFKTKTSEAFCIGDKVSVKPDPFVAHSVGEKTRYISIPSTNADLCSADGQELNPWGFGWAWSVADTNVAQVSHFESAGQIKDNCNFGCLPSGSDVSSVNSMVWVKYNAEFESDPLVVGGTIPYTIVDDPLSDNNFYSVSVPRSFIGSEFIPIDTSESYNLSGLFQSAGVENSRIYFGIQSYDEDYNPISAWYVYRVGSDALVTAISDTQIDISASTPLSGWVQPPGYAGHRSIGFYYDGNTSNLPDYVFYFYPGCSVVPPPNNSNYYCPDENQGVYSSATDTTISLNTPLPADVLAQIRPGITVVKNHRSGGAYFYIAAANQLVPADVWKEYRSVDITGEAFNAVPGHFYPETKYIKLLFLLNYGQAGLPVELWFDDILFAQEGAVCEAGDSCVNGVMPQHYCGNGTVDPGEDCDIGIPGEIVGQSCSLNCLRPGSSAPNCGDGVVTPAQGEECDTADPETRVGCSQNCIHLGSTNNPLEAAEGQPLCGSGEVTVGEDCEGGIDGEVSGTFNITYNDSDLRGLWHFNESSGSFLDSTVYNNNGSQFGGITYGAAGKFGSALSFDGVNDYVSVPDSSSLKITDDIAISAWARPNFDSDQINILVVEAYYETEWVNRLESLGFDVTVNTAINSMAEVQAINPDVVACLMPWWGCAKFALFNTLYDAGYTIFTEGNDNINNIRPISSAVLINDPAGTIVPTGEHPLSDGWTTLVNSGNDWRGGITLTHPNAFAISRDNTLNYIETIYLEEPGKGRWFHYQPSSVAPDILIDNAIKYLTRDEIVGKGSAYNLFLDNQTLKGFINNNPVEAPIESGWNHIVLSFDGAVQNLYVNGILRRSSLFADNINTSSAGLSIGRGFSGVIDEVQVWDKALSRSEVSDLYNADSETDIKTTEGNIVNIGMAGFTCSANCLHIGSKLSQEWCDDNPSWADNSACLNAVSVCGNGLIEFGEECEIINTKVYVFDALNPLSQGILTNAPISSCSASCLLQDICGTNVPASLLCLSSEEGCNSDCTLKGSSVEGYDEPSLCGDAEVGIGEYSWCEWPDLLAFNTPGENPIQAVTAVGLGVVNPATLSQDTKIQSAMVSVREIGGNPQVDLTPEQRTQLTDTADYSLQCGYKEFYDAKQKGLVSSWSAEGNANDNRGINDCTLMNGAGFVDGSPAGNAFNFDGVDDYLDCGTNSSLNITGAITMEAWFNISALSSLSHRMLITNRGTANYFSLIGPAGRPFMSLRINDAQRTLSSNFSPQLNTWYHVAGTFDGSMMRIYVNGVLRNSAGPFIGSISNSFARTYIGRYTSGNFNFNGALDEIKIYNRALSPAEITANYNISSTGNFNYCPTNGDGVGYNSCCYPRPERISAYPADGTGLTVGEGVCRNSNIFVTFNGDIDAATLTNNLVLALGYSTTTPANILCGSLGLKDVTALVDDTLAYSDTIGINQANGFWQNIWRGIKRFFAWFIERVNASITNDANIDVWCDSGLFGVPMVAKITDANGVVQETVATIFINRLLNTDSTYAVFMRGGKNGIKDTRGVGIGNPDRQTDLHDSFLFHTSDQLCKMESVNVEPPSFIFASPAVAHPFTAYVKSTNGQFISPIAGVYDWTWDWAPSSDPVFAIPTDGTPGDQAVASISSKDIEGSRIATARATVISDLDTADSQIDQIFSGDTELISVFCANPWPPREYYPFEEGISFGSILNDDGTDGAGVFNGSALPTVGVNYFNFKMAYCADAGVETSRSDDLPYLKPFIFTSGLPDLTNLKRFLFFNDINNDAIGVQVFSNPDHDSAAGWFAKRYGLPAGFNSITIDGYGGITDGNNYYISALNEASPDSIYYNIYLFSINEDAQESTRQVFNKLIDSLEFNINLSDYRYCADDPDILCNTDFDCLDDLGNPLVEGGTGLCSADKTKMLRDWERLQVIRDIQDKISLMSKPPEMKAGTYLPGQTRSIWPSWGNLSNVIGGIGVDPLNNWTSCGYCHAPGGPIDAVEQLCSFDSDCVAGSGEICVSIDSQTCWDSVNSRFICPNKASVLGYRIESDGNYMLYGPLEHFADVNNFVSTTHFDIASACAPGVTEVPVVGACGNNIVNLGEQCDPPGSIRHNSIACIVNDIPSVEVERCSSSCQWEAAGCESPFICGNARVETGEVCDDGSRNGTYGNCNSVCTGFNPQYCGNSIRDYNTSGNPLELCDLGPLNGVYGQGCSYDCQGVGLRCGDGILQPDTAEECDDGNNINTDSCSNACIKLVSTFEETEETPGVCGNNKIDEGEVCDKGVNNGIKCAPTYGEYCNYCSYDCKKVLYVEPTEYCGNQELDVMETDIEGNDLYESCEYMPKVCTGLGCFGPFILFNPNTSLPIDQRRVEVDGCRQKYNYDQTAGKNMYTTYTGIYKCKNQCVKYENACNLCGHATFDQGGVKPRVTILNPLSGNNYFWSDWNANLYARFYFRYSDFVTASGSARLAHEVTTDHAKTFVAYNEETGESEPEDIFRNAYTTPRGVLANLACNDVYFLCFSRNNLSATPDNSCLSYNLPSEFLWSYEVNGEAGTIDNEYVLSPPVPEGSIRVVLRWTLEDSAKAGGGYFGLGIINLADGGDTYSNRLYNKAKNNQAPLELFQPFPCYRTERDANNYLMPFVDPNPDLECGRWPESSLDREGSYMHEGGNAENTFIQSMTINMFDPAQAPEYGAFIEKAPYSIFAEAQGPSGGMPIGTFISGHLQVEIYEYHNPNDVPGSSPDTIYKPDMVFNLSLAQRSSNPGARYWHILDLFRQDSDSDYGYVIAPKNKIITGSSQLGDSWAGIPSGGDGGDDGWSMSVPGVVIQPLYGSPVCGDGVKEMGEFCDAGVNNGTCDCNATCTGYMTNLIGIILFCNDQGVFLAPTCGDGLVEGDEVCDAGDNNGICDCNSTCTGNTQGFPPLPLSNCDAGFAT